ncbi:MAG: hypothetical protein ACI835_004972 [Planctomycetota bacterium]|jgi:hypothetical protein
MTTGPIQKMRVEPSSPVQYSLPVGDEELPLNPHLGSKLTLRFTGDIRCVACDRAIKKSFAQGHCFPCFNSLASTDGCIVRPETCHYHLGTCREPEWGETHCLIPHTVYLSNTSGVKVGITRGLDPRTRWIDQGATQGMTIRVAKDRLESGRVEVALKDYLADRTNWRAMLKGPPEAIDLAAEFERVCALHQEAAPDSPLAGEAPTHEVNASFEYPVLSYPEKIRSHNLDKINVLEGTLMGIKGQYLIFDTAVINMRKYGGYVLEVSA